MATNYAYRIDPAIRRTGRVDENYLLLPPDAAARRRMLAGFLKDKASSESPLFPTNVDEGGWTKLQKASFFLGYTDCQAAVDRILRLPPKDQTLDRLENQLLNSGRTTTLAFYRKELADKENKNNKRAIEHELFPLLRLAYAEVGRHGSAMIEELRGNLDDGYWKDVYPGGDLFQLAKKHIAKPKAEASTAGGEANSEERREQ